MRCLTLALLVPAAILAPLAACSASWGDDDGKPGIVPSGSGGERHYAADGFDTIALGTSADVAVHVGGAYSVVATGSPAALDTLKVQREGHTLKLGQRRGVHWGQGEKVRFTVTLPRIAGADIGGSGSMAVDRAEGPQFSGNIGGSGSIDVRAMRVDKASFAIGGSGSVKAAGSASRLGVSIGGSGGVQAPALVAETADISVAGAGSIRATVRRSASVSIVGSGDVILTGGAKCSVSKMGSGNVRCS
jgi:hypothetical protein